MIDTDTMKYRMVSRHLVPSQIFIKHLVHTKRSLKFGPIQNVRAKWLWTGPNIKNLLAWTNVSMDILNRTKCDQISRTFFGGPYVLDIFNRTRCPARAQNSSINTRLL